MRMLKVISCVLAAGLLAACPAHGQTTFPTAAGTSVKVPGQVPLQCNASGASCAPATSSNPVPVTVAGGTSVPTGTAGSPNASVVTVQGISGGTAQPVGGDVASGAADSGNPLKIGGVYNSTLPTFTTGQRGDIQISSRGIPYSVPTNPNGTAPDFFNGSADTISASFNGFAAQAYGRVFNGSTWDRQRGDANATVIAKGLTAGIWNYASGTTGILSNTTTAVTIKAAAGAGVRNYIDSCQISTTAFGAAVPLAIRDGAGGTVKWAVTVPTAGFLQPINVMFDTPIQGTANTLLEIVTTTANTSGTAMVNCQGHTGS